MNLPEQSQISGHVFPQNGTSGTACEEWSEQFASLLIGPHGSGQVVLVPKQNAEVIQRSGQDSGCLEVGG